MHRRHGWYGGKRQRWNYQNAIGAAYMLPESMGWHGWYGSERQAVDGWDSRNAKGAAYTRQESVGIAWRCGLCCGMKRLR